MGDSALPTRSTGAETPLLLHEYLMSTQTEPQAEALARWLDAQPEGGALPSADLEAEVVEAVYALQPQRAPAPSVTLDDILGSIASGPFATTPSGATLPDLPDDLDDLDREEEEETPNEGADPYSAADLPEPRGLSAFDLPEPKGLGPQDPSLRPAPAPLPPPLAADEPDDASDLPLPRGLFDATDLPEPVAFQEAQSAPIRPVQEGAPEDLPLPRSMTGAPEDLPEDAPSPPVGLAAAELPTEALSNEARPASDAEVEAPPSSHEVAAAALLQSALEGALHAPLEPEIQETLDALRPDRVPLPALDLDSLIDSVTTGPFAGGEVVPLPTRPPAPATDELEEDLFAAAPPAQPANVVPLADARKGGRPWWLFPGLGVAAVAALALLVVGPMMNKASPQLESASSKAAPPASAASTPKAKPTGGMARREQDFAATEAPPPAADPSRAEFAPAEPELLAQGTVLDATLEESAGEDLASAPVDAPALGAETTTRSTTGPPAEAEEDGELALADADEVNDNRDRSTREPAPAPPVTTATGGASGASSGAGAAPAALQETVGRAAAQPKKEEAKPAAAVAAEKSKADDAVADAAFDWGAPTAAPAPAASAPAAPAPSAEAPSADVWGVATAEPSPAALRAQAFPPSVSPSRGSLRAKYPDVAAADEAVSVAKQASDLGAINAAYEPLLAHSDSNVAMDTAYEMARAARQGGQSAKALGLVERGLARSGGSGTQRARLLALKGQILESQGDTTGAVKAYQAAIAAQ